MPGHPLASPLPGTETPGEEGGKEARAPRAPQFYGPLCTELLVSVSPPPTAAPPRQPLTQPGSVPLRTCCRSTLEGSWVSAGTSTTLRSLLFSLLPAPSPSSLGLQVSPSRPSSLSHAAVLFLCPPPPRNSAASPKPRAKGWAGTGAAKRSCCGGIWGGGWSLSWAVQQGGGLGERTRLPAAQPTL